MTITYVCRPFTGTLVVNTVSLSPPPQTLPFLPPTLVDVSTRVILGEREPYAVNGITLDSQPFVATAPLVLSGVVPAGSCFYLLFSGASLATMQALASGTQTVLHFSLLDGSMLTGRVAIQSVMAGSVFQVLVTLLSPLAVPSGTSLYF